MSVYPDRKAGKLTGRWRVEVERGGQRHRGRYDTLQLARLAEQGFLASLEGKGTSEPTGRLRAIPEAPVVTLGDLFEKSKGKLWAGDATEEEAHRLIEGIFKHVARGTLLPDVTTSLVDDLIVSLRAKGIADQTILNHQARLSKLLKWGKERGYVSVVPHFKWKSRAEGRLRWLTKEEEDTLIALLPAGMGEFVAAALDTGLRLSELFTLQTEQVRDGRVWLYGKNAATGTRTKNHKNRSVPLTERAADILPSSLPWQFTETNLRYHWGQAKAEMKLDQDDEFVIHALRHTFGTRLYRATRDLQLVQDLMGHSDIKTTQRYAHVVDETREEGIKKMQGSA